jgi:AcrR family transcriptional regulator
MSNDVHIRNRILNKAREKFLTVGYTKVTMDEIAFEIGMSKKTVYKHFPAKSDLLSMVIRSMNEEMDAGIATIVQNQQLDFVEKLRQLMGFVLRHISGVGKRFLQDLQRSAPSAWIEIEQARRQRIFTNFSKLISEGTRKGVFRKGLNEDLLVLMFAALVQGTLNPEVLSHLPLSASEAFASVQEVFFEGILTDDARAQYHDRAQTQARKKRGG